MIRRSTKLKMFCLWALVVVISRWLRLSALIGSSHLIISGIATTLPLAGSFLPLAQTGGLLAILAGIKYLLCGLPLTLWIPTACAALSWSSSIHTKKTVLTTGTDIAFNVLLPLSCLVIFVTHPEAGHAFYYAFYWFIPPALWVTRHAGGWNKIFLISLQSTFIAHAVGNIMWLYTVPMSAPQWTGLIPLVAIERLTMAGLGTLTYALMTQIISRTNFIRSRFYNRHRNTVLPIRINSTIDSNGINGTGRVN